MKISYSDKYYANIGEHIMPIKKFGLVKDSMLGTNVFLKIDAPYRASIKDLLRVHSSEYIDSFLTGRPRMLAESNLFPWSRELVESVLHTNGGCIQAAYNALENRVSANIASGFHHAHRNNGSGFCTFNGLAIAIKKLQSEGKIKKAMVIDCDFHYGDGTANIFKEDESVCVLSFCGSFLGGAINSKFNKVFQFEEGTKSSKYLDGIKVVEEYIFEFKPDFIFYQAGADAYKGDPFNYSRGKAIIDLDIEDLRLRDRYIFEQARKNNIPIAYVLAGGYCEDLQKIIEIHTNTFLEAEKVMGQK